jgi:hypothetical protein
MNFDARAFSREESNNTETEEICDGPNFKRKSKRTIRKPAYLRNCKSS